MKLLDIHSVVTLIGALALSTFLFVHPALWSLWDIAGSFVLLAGGQGTAEALVGLKNRLQGGSNPPDTIVPPAAAPEPQAGSLSQTPKG